MQLSRYPHYVTKKILWGVYGQQGEQFFMELPKRNIWSKFETKKG